MILRELGAADRGEVHEILVACGAFSEEEVRVALEMTEGDYPTLVVEAEGRVRGFACVGRAPLTLSTWYLYWLCIHPEAQGAGMGRALHAYTEEYVRRRGGERLVLETSGRADYVRARRFYRSAGYREAGRIPDFYRPGDDCVLYCKRL